MLPTHDGYAPVRSEDGFLDADEPQMTTRRWPTVAGLFLGAVAVGGLVSTQAGGGSGATMTMLDKYVSGAGSGVSARDVKADKDAKNVPGGAAKSLSAQLDSTKADEKQPHLILFTVDDMGAPPLEIPCR